jgi:hypothetical protein
MTAEHRHTESIDLDRAIYDAEYRRAVIEDLKTQRRGRDAPAAPQPAVPAGERAAPARPRHRALAKD